MKNLVYQIKHARLRKLPVLAALIAVLVVPGVIRASAEEPMATAEDDTLVVANVNEDGELEVETPATEEVPVPEPTDNELPATEEEQEIEDVTNEDIINDETNEDPVADVDTPQTVLDRYITFAIAEHPGVAVTEVTFVWKNGVKSAKVVFEDGWKVYIGVSDGSTLSVADNRGKVHRCQRRMKQWKPHFNWHRQHKSYYQWWLSQQNQQRDSEAETGRSQNAESRRTGPGRSAEERNKKSHEKKKDSKHRKHHQSRSNRH